MDKPRGVLGGVLEKNKYGTFHGFRRCVFFAQQLKAIDALPIEWMVQKKSERCLYH